MKKVIIFCPYFGTLPKKQTELFLKSCSMNIDVDWLFMTDDRTLFEYPKNVKVLYITLDGMRREIQKKFDFKIALDTAYKMCDFKPTLGYVFQDLIKGYDYWGHCDMSDSIFGDIMHGLDKDLERNYDKVGFLGHLTLYRNVDEVNKRIFLKAKDGRPLSSILGVRDNMAFDETPSYGIDHVYADNGYMIKRIDDSFVDISTRSHSFRKASWSDDFTWLHLQKEKYIIEWKNGKLYKIWLDGNNVRKKEIIYVHYQKRKMGYEIDIENANHYYIVPNKFVVFDTPIDKKIIRKYTRDPLINWTLLKIRANKLKKIIRNKIGAAK